jgi:dGTPase
LNLLSAQLKIDADSNAYAKMMNIIDNISGMTDLFALKLYRNLRGIEMPHI